MADDCGEVVVVDSKAGVRLAEGATGVRLRAPEHLTHHEHLVTLDSSEIDPFEIRCKLWVAENPVVKIVDDSAHGRPAANGFVVADGPSHLVTHWRAGPSLNRMVETSLLTMYRPHRESVRATSSARRARRTSLGR